MFYEVLEFRAWVFLFWVNTVQLITPGIFIISKADINQLSLSRTFGYVCLHTFFAGESTEHLCHPWILLNCYKRREMNALNILQIKTCCHGQWFVIMVFQSKVIPSFKVHISYFLETHAHTHTQNKRTKNKTKKLYRWALLVMGLCFGGSTGRRYCFLILNFKIDIFYSSLLVNMS